MKRSFKNKSLVLRGGYRRISRSETCNSNAFLIKKKRAKSRRSDMPIVFNIEEKSSGETGPCTIVYIVKTKSVEGSNVSHPLYRIEV